MYFVTIRQPGYILFAMTPSERAAVGLTEKQEMHVLLRDSLQSPWRVAAEWPVSVCSQTDFMGSLHHVSEDADPAKILERIPAAAKLRA